MNIQRFTAATSREALAKARIEVDARRGRCLGFELGLPLFQSI